MLVVNFPSFLAPVSPGSIPELLFLPYSFLRPEIWKESHGFLQRAVFNRYFPLGFTNKGFFFFQRKSEAVVLWQRLGFSRCFSGIQVWAEYSGHSAASRWLGCKVCPPGGEPQDTCSQLLRGHQISP